MKRMVFRCKRDWKSNWREFLWGIAYLLAAGLCIWVLTKHESLQRRDYLQLFAIMFFCILLAFLTWKRILFPKVVLKLLPEGIWGTTNFPNTKLIPWEHVCCVRLETDDGRRVIGVYTDWPHGIPDAWKELCGSRRRALWKRCNRKQAPLVLYIHDAAAPPEEILHTIQNELIHARERGLAPNPPEEGGTLSC